MEPYLIWKWLHIVSFTCWMAAMFYLPRLYVYHAGVAEGSEASELFKVMERRLLRFICNPAMILTFVFGGLLLHANPDAMHQGWFHVKFTLVLILSGFHGACSRWRKDFDKDANRRSQKFYRIANEVPTLLLIAIVFLAVLKPF
ncbi:protoporphyrinogen oxidase HemJ [bacterium]|nr:protoporphyrinogen oxidase HemJ [bacterium]